MLHRYTGAVATLALLAACPPGHALAGGKRDFVSGPWKGVALFGSEENRFRGCIAGVSGPDQPKLVWIHWNRRGGAEVTVRSPPWTLRTGQTFPVTLSIDDAWRADATAEVLDASGGSRPATFSILPPDLQAFLGRAATGRTLTIERKGESRISLSLSGVDRMLEKLDRCLHRGMALQERADRNDLRAEDIFVPQEDAEAFARWADRLAMLAHEAAALIRQSDQVRLVADSLVRRETSARFAGLKFALNLGIARKVLSDLDPEFAELPAFRFASGDDRLGGALRGRVAQLLDKGKLTISDTEAAIAATSRDDMEEVARIRDALAARSHLGYAGDNIYLWIRNFTRSDAEVEYHANEAAKSINWLNVELVKAALLLHPDTLARELPATIAASRYRIAEARRWIRSGRALLDDASKRTDAATPETRGILRKLLDEEAAHADRFEAVLDEAEAALRAGGPLPEALRARLAHGGARSGAALLLDRVQLRFKLGIAG